jgi:hypothetical protein
MTLSPLTTLILCCTLVFLFTQPVVAQVPEWRESLPNDTISSISLSTNGDHIVFGGSKGGVYLLSRNGSEVWSKGFQGEQLVKITGDSSRIFAGSREELYSDKGAVRLFYQNGTALSKTATGWITDLALAWKGSQLVVGTTGGEVILVSRDGNISILSNNAMNLLTRSTSLFQYLPIESIAISADGTTVPYSVRINKNPRFVIFRKSSTRQKIMSNVIELIAVSSNGTYIATSEGEGSLGKISSRYINGTERWSTKTPRVTDLVISEDGSIIVAGTVDDSVFSLNNTGHVLWKYPVDGEVTKLSINSLASKIIAGTSNGTLYLFDRTGYPLGIYHEGGVLDKSISDVEISRDGSTIIAVVDKRELLYFTSSKFVPVSSEKLTAVNISSTSPVINDSYQNPDNITMTSQAGLNFLLLSSGNSKISMIIQEIIYYFWVGRQGLNHNGDVSMTIDPRWILQSDPPGNLTPNSSVDIETSNNKTIKSNKTASANAPGTSVAPHTTPVKSNKTASANATGTSVTPHTTPVKSNKTASTNTTGTSVAPHTTPVK